MLGGRGAGKTFAGAFWLHEQARLTPLTLALVGPALHDVREVMVEGPSGIRAMALDDARPHWEASRKRLVWPNGSVAYAFSAEDPDSLRGPQFHAAWADEFCAWREPERPDRRAAVDRARQRTQATGDGLMRKATLAP